MAQSLTELLGSGAEKLGGWGLETGAKAKKKLSEIADIATANDTSTAGDKVTAIGQSLAQGGGALLGDVGKAIDTVNPINYAPKLFGAKTLSEQGYGTEKLLSNIGKVPGNVITAIGEGGSALSDAIDKTQRVFGGEISAADYGVGLTKDLTKLGASGIQSVFSMAAPLIQPVIGTAFEMTGADKLTASGREIASKGIMDAFGVPEKYREDVKSSLYSSFDIASAAAGIKGSKTMQGLQQAKNSKGINMYLQDGSPMMVPAKGAAKAYNVAKGMLQASLPDMTLAITGAIGSDDSVGTKVGKAIATSLLTVAANHPAIGPDMFKAKKSKLTDSELQAKNDEAIKADTEAVSKSEKSLSQIALDKSDKRNSESKTLGKWTPELEAEYKKSGFSGSRGDYMKGGRKPVTEAVQDDLGIGKTLEDFKAKTKLLNNVGVTKLSIQGKIEDVVGTGKKLKEGWEYVENKELGKTKRVSGWYIKRDGNTTTILNSSGKGAKIDLPEGHSQMEKTASIDFVNTIIDGGNRTQTKRPISAVEKPIIPAGPPKPTLEQVATKTEPKGIYDSFIKTFTLPKELSKGTPAYKTFSVDFSNDFNKALYIIRESRGTRSKSDAKYLDVVMKQTGLDEASARKLGDTVLKNIKFKEGNGDIQNNTITVDANLFGGKTPAVAKEAVIPRVEPVPEPIVTPEPIAAPTEKAPKKARTPKAKPTLSELATVPEPTITPEPTPTEALPFETNATKADLTNNLVNDAVKNEESRNQTSGKFEVATLPGRIGALISEKGGRLLSLGAYLNKIKVVLENGKRVPFNTYIDSVRSSAINIANGILDRYNVRKTVTALPDPGDIKIGNDALEGAVTPMGTVITKDNSFIVKDVLKDIARLRFDHLGFDNKKLAKINALGYVWRINQGRPDIIDKYVPKEYQDFFQSINDETGLTRKIYDDAGNVLTDKKALYEYDPNDMYTRFILSETGKEFMRKNGVKYQLNVDGKDIEYDSVEDLRKAMGMYQAQGKAVTDKTVKNFESILKEKGGASIDIFRIHSPLAQLLDYSGHFGKLVSDIEVVKKFGELQKEKDPSVQAYVDKMTTSENFANPLEQVLNINRAAKGLGEKVSQSLGNLAMAQLLYGSVKNLVQGMTSAQLRRAMYASGAVKGQAGKFTDYKNADNELVQSRLHGEGFLTNYELLPGQSSALKDQIIWWSSAGENSAKTHIALSGMEQALKDNNVPYAKDDALSITEKFQEWASIPENRDRAIEIKSDIKQNNNTVSDVSSMARSQVPFMQRFGFGSMKTYGIGQVTQNLQDIGAITERAIRGKGKISNEQTAKAASRLGVQLGGYALIAATVSQLWKASQPETDNEDELDRQAEAIGNAVAGQAYGNPAASFKNLFTGILSNTGLAPIQAAADIAQVISLFASNDPQGYKAGMNELIRSTVKNSAIGKTIDATAGILSGESLQKIFADALGSVSRENQTRSGVSTGKKTDSRAEFAGNLLGYNTDNAIEQMIYTNFEKSKIAQEYGLKADGIPVGILSTLTRIYTDNARSLGQPGKVFEGVTKYNDNVILQQYVANVINASRDIKTFSDLLASVPGSGKGLDKAREDVKSANDSYEKLLDDTWVTFGIDNSLPVAQKLEILRTKNPVAYNNTVAGIAKSLMYMNKVKDGTAKYSQDEAMKNMYKSDANVDAAISELNGTAPNSVAVIDQINSGLTQFTSDIGEIGLDEAKKKFAYVEAMNKMMNGVSLYSDTYEKALANGTFQYDQVVKTMEDNGYKDFKKDYPITAELIRRGLELRGETQLKPTAGQFPTENGMIGTSGSNQPSSGTPIKSNIQTIGTPKKPKLSELALLKPVQVAPKPIFNPLVQPTEGSLLQMAMRKK